MKKSIALLLSLVLVFSICSVSAFAESVENHVYTEDYNKAVEYANKLSDEELASLCGYTMGALVQRGQFTVENVTKAAKILLGQDDETKATTDLPNEYSFGQGTFIVGLDLKPGTYDITCETSSGSDMDSSMSGLSDFYASQGMSEYADMFGSLSGMYDTIGGLTVMTYKPNTDYYDQYLTLKVGETARIILEDGGKIVISDGTAKLVWVR